MPLEDYVDTEIYRAKRDTYSEKSFLLSMFQRHIFLIQVTPYHSFNREIYDCKSSKLFVKIPFEIIFLENIHHKFH